MPTFNVRTTVRQVLSDLETGPLEAFDKVLVVDNKSQDDTQERLLEFARQAGERWRGRLEIWFNSQNYLLGGSTIVAIRRALALHQDYLLNIHSDGQARAKDIYEMLRLCTPQYPLVLGSRLLQESDVQSYNGLRQWGNQFFAYWQKRILGREVRDLGALMALPLKFARETQFEFLPPDMGYQPMLLMHLLATHPEMRVIERPIHWGEVGKSTVNPWVYGLKHSLRLLRLQIGKPPLEKAIPSLASTLVWPV